MADDGLIGAYLTELRYSLTAGGRRGAADTETDVDDVVDEAQDHLLEAVARLERDGRTTAQAQAEAVARFGSATLVANVFAKEAGKGAAVPTIMTRRAGFAGLSAPLFAIAAAGGMQQFERGALHGAAVACEVVAVCTFLFALWGLRARHAGLGPLGRAAFWLTIASPFLAAPFGWGAGIALVVVLSAVLALLAIAMYRAHVLPTVPLVLFGATPVATIVLAAVLTGVGRDAGWFIAPSLMPAVVGLLWLCWAMWREQAVDGAAGVGPLQTA
jgi:hypothetical protein